MQWIINYANSSYTDNSTRRCVYNTESLVDKMNTITILETPPCTVYVLAIASHAPHSGLTKTEQTYLYWLFVCGKINFKIWDKFLVFFHW